MDWDNIDEKMFKKLVKQLTGTITEKDGDLIPFYVIKGTGSIWCVGPSKKNMLKVLRGTKLYILKFNEDKSKVLAYTQIGDLIIIPAEELIEIGFN